jgi:hypothetical protein
MYIAFFLGDCYGRNTQMEDEMERRGRSRWFLSLALLLVWGSAGWAAEPELATYDRELATVVVGKDGPSEVESKLGNSACLMPSLSGETVSYLYNVRGKDGHYFLRLEVNGQVDAITVSKDPPLTGVCYTPVHHEVSLRTGKGVQLGATMEEVMRLYGKPVERFAVGSMARFRYEAMLDRPYEWDLVFRDGRLVEWSVVTQE